jgi:hypothetical protein
MLARLIALFTARHLALAPVSASELASHGVTAKLPASAGYEYLPEVAAHPDTTLEPIILLDYSHYEIDRQISPPQWPCCRLRLGSLSAV